MCSVISPLTRVYRRRANRVFISDVTDQSPCACLPALQVRSQSAHRPSLPMLCHLETRADVASGARLLGDAPHVTIGI